jgi:tetratricopeptide (TPR) repeat protein
MVLLIVSWCVLCASAEREAIERALDEIEMWRTPQASEAVAAAERVLRSGPELAYLQGQLALLKGDYDASASALRLASAAEGGGGIASELLSLVEATERITRTYATTKSPKGHFSIRYAPGLDAVMVPWMAEVLDAAYERLTPVFDDVPEGPIRVEIYPSASVLAEVSPLSLEEIRTSGTIALCKYGRLMVTSPASLVYGYEWADTAVHELAHLLITRRSRNTVPVWLHEGLAKYHESLWRSDAPPRLDVVSEGLLARALQQRSLIGFDAMSPSMAKLPSQQATATAFAEVFTVIEYLYERSGEGMVGRLLDAMAKGMSDREAVALVAGMPWAEFEGAWKAALRRKRLKVRRVDYDLPLLFKGHDDEDAVLALVNAKTARKYVWLGDQLVLQGRHKAAIKEYRKASAVDGAESPLIASKLGGALLKAGALDEAVSVLEGALSDWPHHMLVRLYLGQAWLGLNNAEQARPHLEAALYINPFDLTLHRDLSAAYELLGLDALAARAKTSHSFLMEALENRAP